MIKTKARDYLIPTRLEAIFYLVFTGLILFVANFSFLTNYLLHDSGNVPDNGEAAFQMYFDRIFEFIEGLPFVPSSAVFIFWSLTGLAIFSLAQSVYNVYAEVKSDIAVDTHFLHPSNYTRWQFWGEVFVQFAAHVLLYSLIILWSLLMGFVLMPLTAVLIQRMLSDVGLLNLITFLSSFVLLYIGVIIFALLLKLFFKRKQLMV